VFYFFPPCPFLTLKTKFAKKNLRRHRQYIYKTHTQGRKRGKEIRRRIWGWASESRTFFSSFSFYNTSEEYDFFYLLFFTRIWWTKLVKIIIKLFIRFTISILFLHIISQSSLLGSICFFSPSFICFSLYELMYTVDQNYYNICQGCRVIFSGFSGRFTLKIIWVIDHVYWYHFSHRK
jgi:hypothetical protein